MSLDKEHRPRPVTRQAGHEPSTAPAGAWLYHVRTEFVAGPATIRLAPKATPPRVWVLLKLVSSYQSQGIRVVCHGRHKKAIAKAIANYVTVFYLTQAITTLSRKRKAVTNSMRKLLMIIQNSLIVIVFHLDGL